MAISDKASMGLIEFDQIINNLCLGDNVVWQFDSAYNYEKNGCSLCQIRKANHLFNTISLFF